MKHSTRRFAMGLSVLMLVCWLGLVGYALTSERIPFDGLAVVRYALFFVWGVIVLPVIAYYGLINLFRLLSRLMR